MAIRRRSRYSHMPLDIPPIVHLWLLRLLIPLVDIVISSISMDSATTLSPRCLVWLNGFPAPRGWSVAHAGKMVFWTRRGVCTNIETIVHLKGICHDCYYYCSFGPARLARDT